MFIDETTSREDLLTAIYSEGELVDFCIEKNLDPEFMLDAELLDLLRNWIEAGDECAAC